MLVGTVIEKIWATRKEEGLTGLTFLVVQPGLLGKTDSPQSPLVAVDRIGAGIGDKVIVVQGTPATYTDIHQKIPIDARIIGIVDATSMKDGHADG